MLDFEMVDTNKEVNILYNDVNRNVENFLLEKTRYNLEKYYLGRNIIIYSIKNINFIVKKYPEEKAVEIEIEKFQQ